MHNPVATYRIQFHKEFTFEDFNSIIPYLQKLGVSTIYASPIFEATPGSTHGYDGVNPHRINPEIGTEEQLRDFSKKLREQGISWLQDIVPNHMAYHPNNLWLMDVLEKGQQSAYASFFDVAWTGELYQGRIMVPFLGSPLEDVIRSGELKLDYHEEQQRLVLKYYDSAYPLSTRSYKSILSAGKEKPSEAIQQFLEQLDNAYKIEDRAGFSQKFDELRLQLASLMKNEVVKKSIQNKLDEINKDTAKIQELADEQVYRLCHWQETDKQINFRRFFTVNGLICLNIQYPEVFEIYHQYIKQLQQEGIFQGLRIDHIDGLYDPSGYLEQLREFAGEETYIVVEKILEPGEDIPKRWPIQGNTGYDYLSIVNNLFTNKSSEEAFTGFYHQLVGEGAAVEKQIHEKKAYILYENMGGELDNLYQLFVESDLVNNKLKDVQPDVIKKAIGEFLIQCPVYRYYGNNMPLDKAETAAVQMIFDRIRGEKKELSGGVDLLEEALLKSPLKGEEGYKNQALKFYQRLMQFSGPLMAKGVEDTLMYTYNRFVGHNEVGDSPEAFGMTPKDFHQRMQDRQANWPLSINGTSTHDTKRGEDVRARLNVLTDLPDEWLQKVQEWQQMNKGLKQDNKPDTNDEYLIYQTIVGAYPMPEQHEDDFNNRIQEYLQKALREAKVHSNWTTPDEAYEKATKAFAAGLLDQKKPFWESFSKFHKKVADFGITSSLSQVLLKFTSPGVPDVYQGTELWDLSLVDPDNRRAVDYEKRQKWLNELNDFDINDQTTLWQELWQSRYDGRIKLWLTHILLNARKRNGDLFAKGEYVPLKVEGAYKDYVLAFARKYQQSWMLVAAPLHLAALSKEQQKDILELDWKDTRVILPKEAPAEWEHLLLKTSGKAEKTLAAQELFSTLPLALLKLQAVNERGAGILLHISSLPSPFGIGDMGPEARAFADFLHRSHQKFWQLLPLNPTEAGQGHSPYSSTSSRAGNPLLISPELLVKEGLLDAIELKKYHLRQEGKTNYAEAERVKGELFEKAWQSFRKGGFEAMQQQFVDFCGKEAAWLDDFAIYMVLKAQNEGKPWYQWPAEYKLRKPEALEKIISQEAEKLEKIKWLQFVFAKQWKRLRTYCNNRAIQMFGDMPFYISYDSVDVWSHRDIFSLDEEGNMTGVAGVPPDAFSEDGQLWGMPVFKWDVLKERDYDWWIGRFVKNMELFDIVRLDHFRAFEDYWEVPAGEETARDGEWKQGPGAEFFNFVQKELGELPFIAEDLGEITEAVLKLRDEFNLPGMRILQFAFGDEMPQNFYIPHNYTRNSIAYTGTHDNNTVLGWYRQEGKENHKQIEQYVGRELTEDDMYWVMCRLAYASVAKTAILPIQDLLGIDEMGRMNTPGAAEGNWLWRLLPGQITRDAENRLKEWTWLYNRG
jgi:malto-oligosyltrehalose synthase/4-alpha-glucanotransferase